MTEKPLSVDAKPWTPAGIGLAATPPFIAPYVHSMQGLSYPAVSPPLGMLTVIPSISDSTATRVPNRVPRGRGNNGRGLRAQQERRQQASSQPPPYVPTAKGLGADDEVYNPLAPKASAEEDLEAFHSKAALELLEEPDYSANPFAASKVNPKTTKNSDHTTQSQELAMPMYRPNSTVTANSPFHLVVNAKPFVPPNQAAPNIPPEPSPEDENTESDEELGPVAPTRQTDALRVDADTFFTEQIDESQVKQAEISFKKKQENPYSITSLQGVRATMPSVEPTIWYQDRYGNEQVMIPAAFEPDEPKPPPQIKHHMSVCHPKQFPSASLNLFHYLCYHCPITCQLSKIQERPPDLKLGGICGDINPACIAHLVETLSGIKLDALDVFGHNFGRCNLWLHNSADAPKMMAALDRRVWMSPVPHGYAVVVDDEDSREYLLWYLEGLREHGPKRVRFPRHLMTCEKWIV